MSVEGTQDAIDARIETYGSVCWDCACRSQPLPPWMPVCANLLSVNYARRCKTVTTCGDHRWLLREVG